MAQLAIVTQGLAPGMWAVVSKVVSWEWLESSGKVRWLVETVLPPHIVRSAIPAVISMESVKSSDRGASTPKPTGCRRASRKRTLRVAIPTAS